VTDNIGSALARVRHSIELDEAARLQVAITVLSRRCPSLKRRLACAGLAACFASALTPGGE
jgi:hypothetical protein